MKKLQITIQSDFEIIGIISNLAHHTLAWQMNSLFELDFSKVPSEENDNFIFYKSSDIYLIKNKIGNEFLMKSLKKFDYLLRINNFKLKSSLLNKLKSTPDIIFSGQLDKERIPKTSLKLISRFEY